MTHQIHAVIIALLATLSALACTTVERKAPPDMLGWAAGIPAGDPVAAASVFIYGEKGVTIGGSFCNGVLIRPRVVLTAAHCLKEHIPYYVRVHPAWSQSVTPAADDVHFDRSGGVSVDRYIIHPRYHEDAKSIAEDLAIAHLSEDLPAYMHPAKLAPESLQLSVVSMKETSAILLRRVATQADLGKAIDGLEGERLIVGSYAPFDVYRGLGQLFTKMPVVLVNNYVKEHELGAMPRGIDLVIKGHSGSGAYAVHNGKPQLVGILSVLITSRGKIDFDAIGLTDVRAYRPWITESLTVLGEPALDVAER